MSIEKLFIGIDTSCYTTSVAADFGGQMISLKKPLEVKVGECGLRQSEAFFQHSRNLPMLFDELSKQLRICDFENAVITVSQKPRNVEGSYMPVFTAGEGYAKTIASMTGAKLNFTSHQEGHIMAALYSCKNYGIMDEPFLTYHISGGTTELLLAKRQGNSFVCEIIGGTKDLPAGQFIDRIGVKCGYEFPCGRYVDYTACSYEGEKPKVKTAVADCFINFSGEETRYSRILEKEKDTGYAAYCTMKCIAQSIKKSSLQAMEKYNVKNLLMVGGVSSSQFIREEFSDVPGVFFAKPDLCTDNAVGVCLMGKLIEQELM